MAQELIFRDSTIRLDSLQTLLGVEQHGILQRRRRQYKCVLQAFVAFVEIGHV